MVLPKILHKILPILSTLKSHDDTVDNLTTPCPLGLPILHQNVRRPLLDVLPFSKQTCGDRGMDGWMDGWMDRKYEKTLEHPSTFIIFGDHTLKLKISMIRQELAISPPHDIHGHDGNTANSLGLFECVFNFGIPKSHPVSRFSMEWFFRVYISSPEP